MRLSLKDIAFFLFKVGVAVFLLGMLHKIGFLDLAPIAKQPISLRLSLMLIAGCGFCLGAMALLAWRLMLLLSVQDVSIRFKPAFVLTVVCNLVGAVLPGIVAGDIAKFVWLHKLVTQDRCRLAGALLIDRLIGLYGLLLLGALSAGYAVLAGLGIRADILRIAAGGTIITTVGIVVLIELAHRRGVRTDHPNSFYRMVGRLGNALAAYRKQPLKTFGMLTLAITSHALMVGTFICSAYAIRDTVTLGVHFALDPLAMVLNAVPLSPGGVGLAEGAFAFLFASVGSPNGALVGLVGRLLLYGVSLFIAIFWWLAKYTGKRYQPVGNLSKVEVKAT